MNIISLQRSKRLYASVLAILSLALLCFQGYGEILDYYFTSIDSFSLLKIARIDTVRDIPRVFTSPLGGGFPFGTYYRPVSEFSYALDYLIWGKNPAGYHFTALVLHLLNSIMVFIFASLVFRDRKMGTFIAWLTSCLFLLNPINNVIIPSLSKRQELLYSLMCSLSVLALLKMCFSAHGRRWYGVSLLLGFLAIFSKETAFVLTPIAFLTVFVFDESGGYKERSIKGLKCAVPFMLFSIVNVALHLYLFEGWGVNTSLPVSGRLHVAAKVFFTLFWPLGALALEERTRTLIFMAIFICSLAVLAVFVKRNSVTGLLEKLLRKERKVYSYLCSFLLVFLIFYTASGKALYTYQYLPGMVLILLVMITLTTRFKNLSLAISAKTIAVIYVLFVLAYSPLWTDYQAWKNSSAITQKTLRETAEMLDHIKEGSIIYMVNWPGFIGRTAFPPGERASILLDYTMNSWIEWEGKYEDKNITFVPVSYVIFPAGEIRAEFDYIISRERIMTKVKMCRIRNPLFPYNGDTAFTFSINDRSEKIAELLFKRGLEADEVILLYDVDGVRMVKRDETILGARHTVGAKEL